MTAAEARSQSNALVEGAEAALQARIAGYRAAATPEAIARELEKVPAIVRFNRRVLDKAIAKAIKTGENVVRHFRIGPETHTSQFDPLAGQFWATAGSLFHDELLAEGFSVKYRTTRYVVCGEPEPRPKTWEYLIGHEFDVSW